MYRLLFVAAVCLGATRHPELRGEEPEQSDIDDGQCIPIKCVLGVPPVECTSLCAQKRYVPTCRPPADFCLCQRLVGNKVELVSPDEVLDQPPDPEVHFIFAVFLPIKNLFSSSSVLPTSPPSAEPFAAVRVNVHEGRLLWSFRYILSGLLLLIVALLVYEAVLCGVQARRKDRSIDKLPAEFSKPKIVTM